MKCSEPEIKNYKADNNWHEEGNAVHEPVAAFGTLLIFVVKSHDEGDELAASEEIARPTMFKVKTFDEGNLVIPVDTGFNQILDTEVCKLILEIREEDLMKL